MDDGNFYTIKTDKQTATISLCGDWVIHNSGKLTKTLQEILPQLPKKILVNPQDLKTLDTVGAWILINWLDKCQEKKIEVHVGKFAPDHELMFKRVQEAAAVETPPPPPKPNPLIAFVNRVGVSSTEVVSQIYLLINFLGETAIIFLATCWRANKWRLPDLARQIEETGINAIPVVSVMAFMISVVLAYQGAYQLKQFGADIYTIDLTAIAILREMGVLLTSIMVAGRSGSAFAAEIGVMKVNEEIDALRTLGLSPFSVLVLPRMIALIITLPLLTFLADMMGLLGAAFLIVTLLDISFTQFVNHLYEAIVFSTFGVGILKAPVFAMIIAAVGCLRGMQVTNSAESVGQLTTKAVVESILLVMFADALFSILFTQMNV